MKCKHEELLDKFDLENNREYWLMTEVFTYLHNGSDKCNCKKFKGSNKYRSDYTFQTTKRAFKPGGVPSRKYVQWLESQLNGSEMINAVLGTLLTITWAIVIIYFVL
ncbi:MAG TPA: hypothetical protein VLA13_01125 [Massilibacterium sp.]|nr:hypothetical protein [Massilibacterium sp.]